MADAFAEPATPTAAAPIVGLGRGLRVGLVKDPFTALGLAVAHLLGKPAYRTQPFSAWAKSLAGHVERRDYRFVFEDGNRVVGMLAWSDADEAAAERWAAGDAGARVGGRGGDCVVFTVWSADTADAREPLLRAARLACANRRAAYFRRFYADGRVRPVRLGACEPAARHLARAIMADAAAADRGHARTGG